MPPDQISLLSIYRALGSPALFAIGNDDDNPNCLLARVANAATSNALATARFESEASLEKVSVADLAADRHQKLERFCPPD